MILILSQQQEQSTDQVIDWIQHLSKIPVLRLNDEDLLNELEIDMQDEGMNVYMKCGSKHINLGRVGSYWYRRGELNMPKVAVTKPGIDPAAVKGIFMHLAEENKKTEEFLHHMLSQVYGINTFKDNFINKLIVLHTAFKCGLKIPHTVVTTQTGNVGAKYGGQGLITKSISECISIRYGNALYSSATERVPHDMLEKNKSYRLPSLFQNEIKKQFEIRTFYLKGDCYSMAIFSQNDERTRLDYRNYNMEKMNRMVPFSLPGPITLKIDKLMKTLSLDSGSIDLIRDDKGEFIFLEVNPVGQFGMTSIPCNYFLEREIAGKLIKNHCTYE